mmetsp:Transcript_4976/g.15620  ORF Transcript_4976/g.15620 Transcript_4976/m.15620 type:complete len:198 (-) Transcript_4976:76-669(-)
MMLPVDVHGQTLTVDVDPDVELDHVVALEHRLVARVGGPVRRHVVDAAARREGDATLGEMRPDKLPNLRKALRAQLVPGCDNQGEGATTLSSSFSTMSIMSSPGCAMVLRYFLAVRCTSAASRCSFRMEDICLSDSRISADDERYAFIPMYSQIWPFGKSPFGNKSMGGTVGSGHVCSFTSVAATQHQSDENKMDEL